MTGSVCPEPSRWERLLKGALSDGEQAELTAHLDACPRCQDAFDELVSGGPTWAAVAAQLKSGPAGSAASLEDIIRRATSARGALCDETHEPEDDELSLDFLAPADDPEHLGRLDHYDVLEVIGRGGMGVVLKAFDRSLKRVVAVKVLAPALAARATSRRRFVREAQAAASIRDEHVIDIHAVEEAAATPYLVMEYIDGLSLEERLRRAGPLELKEMLRIAAQTAAGLAAAHAQGVIHRDVKPANILLENGVERVKITDFGLACVADDASLTQSGIVAGTPNYMSPEQSEGRALDHRSDLFSLGSVLYAMCTGRAPFRAPSAMAVLKRVCGESPRPIRDINPEIPEWLEAIVTKLHARHPDDRFQSAAEVAELLSRHLAHLQRPELVAAPQPVSGVPSPSPVATSGPRGAGARSLFRRRGSMLAAALVVAVLGLGFAEATGVTSIAITVIRILTPEGTLIVEVDDPEVQVTVEGDGGLAIAGAGPQEVRLEPGRYEVRATKDGQSIREELVTITRGGKRIVRISRDPPSLERASLPAVVAVGEVRRFAGHRRHVWSVAFSPDERRAVTGSWDHTVRLWDLATGEELRRYGGNARAIKDVCFAPDGERILAACTDGTLRLWDVETAEEVQRFTGHEAGVWAARFSPNGRLMASAAQDATVRVWNVETGREHKRLVGHQHAVFAVDFSPDGTRLLTGGGRRGAAVDLTARLWDLSTGEELQRLNLPGHVEDLRFLPDGGRVVMACGGGLLLWDLETGREIHNFSGHQEWVVSLALSAHGKRMVSGGHSGVLQVWDVERGRILTTLRGHSSAIRVALSGDGLWALTGAQEPDKTMRLWRLPLMAEEQDAASGEDNHDHAARAASSARDGPRTAND